MGKLPRSKKLLIVGLSVVALIVLFAALAFFNSGPSLATLRTQYAERGLINDAAPVSDNQSITINASPDKVWSVLTNVSQWPKWQKDIKSVESDKSLTVGSTFKWNNAGSSINSEVVSFNQDTQLVWIGTTFGAKAVHIWHLKPTDQNKTTLSVHESLDGFMLKQLYGQGKLHTSLEYWLSALKTEAEK